MTSNQTAQPSTTAAPLEYDRESRTYYTRYDPTRDSATSQAILDAVAAIEARDPCERSVALYDCIEPDALDALFRPLGDGTSRADGRIEFTFDTYDVRVRADGRLAIRPHRP